MSSSPTAAALAAVFALAAAGLDPARAQDTRKLAEGAAPATAAIDAMRGVIGNWTTAGGAAAWSGVVGGEIVGHIVLTDDKGAPRVQELWIFQPEAGSLVLRQKIMDGPALAEREAKDVFEVRHLIAVEGGKLYFENMTLSPKGDTLEMVVNRPIGPLKVVYTRVK